MAGGFFAFVAATLILLLCPPSGYSQINPDALHVSISLAETTLSPERKIKVSVRIENKTGKTIVTGDAQTRFMLSKYGKDSAKCRWDECFSSAAPPSKVIKNGETVEFEVDLAKLYWNNSISSQYDFRQPPNMFKAVIPGDYSLYMGIGFDDRKTRPDYPPRVIWVTSNEIKVTVEGKR